MCDVHPSDPIHGFIGDTELVAYLPDRGLPSMCSAQPVHGFAHARYLESLVGCDFYSVAQLADTLNYLFFDPVHGVAGESSFSLVKPLDGFDQSDISGTY